MSINKILAVARWEFVEKVRTKAFIISLVITPAFIILMSVVPTLLMTKADTTTTKIGIMDETNQIAPILNSKLLEKFKLPDGKPNYEMIAIPTGDLEKANKMVLQEQISSYIVIDTSIVHSRKFEYVSQNVSNFKEIERLQETVKDIVVSNELQRNGVSPGLVEDVSKPIDLQTVKLSKTGTAEKAEAGSGFVIGYIFIFVLALFILTSGQYCSLEVWLKKNPIE